MLLPRMGTGMRDEQREQIIELLHDVLSEMERLERLSKEEYEAIIKYLAEADACRKLLQYQGINTR